MADRDDDIDEKDEDRQDGGQSDESSSGIGKYFGKANKSLKFFHPKIKKNIKSRYLKNVAITFQSNPKGIKDVGKMHQKTKTKIQYKWTSQYFGGISPKFRVNILPYHYQSLKAVQEASLSWKNIINHKIEDENYQIKLNDKRNVQMKYKRTKFINDKKIRFRLELQSLIQRSLRPKNGIIFETLIKIPQYQHHQYLNSSQFKNKINVKDFYLDSFANSVWKIDFIKKFTFLVDKYKLKQESKVSLNVGGKNSGELKSNFQLTDNQNVWTFYGSVLGYKWGIGFDQAKFVYSIFNSWKLGCMYSSKGWEVILNGSNLVTPIYNNLGFYVSNKNYCMILKNKLKTSYGKINYQFSLQNALFNKQLSKLNVGLSLNVNL